MTDAAIPYENPRSHKRSRPRSSASPLRSASGAARVRRARTPGRNVMILIAALVLFVLWLLGVVAFHVTSFAIHLLLVLAVVALVWHFVSRRQPV